MRLETFYKQDGSTVRVRAEITSNPDWPRSNIDWVDVVVTNQSSANKLVGTSWGMGRFAPVRKLIVWPIS